MELLTDNGSERCQIVSGFFYFFFQAEDGIRDDLVTGVQTCALPISSCAHIRPGAALLQGMVACGECGHKMVIQYKHGPRYLCNYLRQQYRVPVCQHIPADAVDAQVVEAFFQALSPLELDVYEQAAAAQQAEEEQVAHAKLQHLERLRYEASLAQRQFLRVDPETRLVAAELETRWEATLAELKRAEEGTANSLPTSSPLLSLPSELQVAF